jgi:hypothetical protein
MTQQAWVLGPLECKVANKLIQRSTHIGKEAATTQKGTTRPPEGGMAKKPDFKLKGELLYKGHGKDNMIVNSNCYSHTTKSIEEGHINKQCMEGLQPPQLEESGDIVHRETRTLMQKEIKCRKQKLKELQTVTTQWNIYEGKGAMNTPPPN